MTSGLSQTPDTLQTTEKNGKRFAGTLRRLYSEPARLQDVPFPVGLLQRPVPCPLATLATILAAKFLATSNRLTNSLYAKGSSLKLSS
jgi:hypothetical protein